MRIAILPLLLLAVVAIGLWQARDWMQRHPQHLPWTPLDLAAPIGMATAPKLAALRDDPAQCRRLLAAAGVAVRPPPDRAPPQPACATPDALRATDLGLRLEPGDLTLSCPVAAALLVWNRQIVQPAARRHFGSEARALGTLGSWNCRTIAGSGRLSEHATANAIDIAAVVTRDGNRAELLADWRGDPARGAFLRDIRDGGCRLFRVVLSPDYNAAHANHLHLDMGPARACK